MTLRLNGIISGSTLIIIAAALAIPHASARVWYVNAGSSQSQDGSSFSHGYHQIGQALSHTSTGDQIWVQAATYSETIVIETPLVGLYGGFSGTETSVSQSNPAVNETVIDGASSNASIITVSSRSSGVTIYGLALQRGTGTRSSDGVNIVYVGGAIFDGGAPDLNLSTCTFQDNHTDMIRDNNIYLNEGGAVYLCCGATATVFNCSFVNNSATEGGGLAVSGGGAAISNCTFLNDSAGEHGGGVMLAAADATLKNNFFLQNTGGLGGGLYASGPVLSGLTLTNNFFTGNSASFNGGGMYTGDVEFETITANTFSSNHAGNGGGAYLARTAIGTVTGNRFTSNAATFDGGGLEAYAPTTGSPSILIANNVCLGNSASIPNNLGQGGGGGIVAAFGTEVLNNTICNNTGGGLTIGSNYVVANNIVAFNDYGIITDVPQFASNLVYLDDVYANSVRNYHPFLAVPSGHGEFSADPLFLDLVNSDLHLKGPSLCIEGGSKDKVLQYGPATDYEGNPRVVGRFPDVGAYEAIPVLTVSTQPGDGMVGEPLAAQPAISAQDGHGNPYPHFPFDVTVSLAPGTGTVGAAMTGTATVTAVNGVASFSGLSLDKAGTGYQLVATVNTSLVHAVNTVGFSVRQHHTFVKPTGNDAADGATWDSARQSVSAALEVTAGPAGEVWVATGSYGAAGTVPSDVMLYGGFNGTETVQSQRNVRSRATIINGGGTTSAVRFVGSAGNGVDGFRITGGAGSIVVDAGFVSHREGGGVYIDDASPRITNNLITANTATVGGGISVVSGHPFIGYNTIALNTAAATTTLAGLGGGVALDGSGEILADNLIFGNVATGQTNGGAGSAAGALAIGSPANPRGGAHDIHNNTLVNNQSTATHGDIGIYSGTPSFVNNILNNHAAVEKIAGTPSFRNNDYIPGVPCANQLPGVTGSNGNSNQAVSYVNAAGNNYHLAAGSTLKDIGDLGVIDPGETDVDLEPRVMGAGVDLGADEVTVPYNLADVGGALAIAGGLQAGALTDVLRLDVGVPAGIDVLDAARLARKVAGLDANP